MRQAASSSAGSYRFQHHLTPAATARRFRLLAIRFGSARYANLGRAFRIRARI